MCTYFYQGPARIINTTPNPFLPHTADSPLGGPAGFHPPTTTCTRRHVPSGARGLQVPSRGRGPLEPRRLLLRPAAGRPGGRGHGRCDQHHDDALLSGVAGVRTPLAAAAVVLPPTAVRVGDAGVDGWAPDPNAFWRSPAGTNAVFLLARVSAFLLAARGRSCAAAVTGFGEGGKRDAVRKGSRPDHRCKCVQLRATRRPKRHTEARNGAWRPPCGAAQGPNR